MKKSDLAFITFQTNFLAKVVQANREALVEIIQTTFSAIATTDPTLALSVLEQLNLHKEGIESLRDERQLDRKAAVDSMTKGLPDYMDLEDGEPDDDQDGD